MQNTIVQGEAAGMCQWPRDATQSDPIARDGHAQLTSPAPPRPRVGRCSQHVTVCRQLDRAWARPEPEADQAHGKSLMPGSFLEDAQRLGMLGRGGSLLDLLDHQTLREMS